MIRTMETAELNAVIHVADLMAAAARTAPKGGGRDKIITLILTGEEKDALASEMHKAAREYEQEFMERDAGNLERSSCVVHIAAKPIPSAINHCSMCGFENCGEMAKAGANCTITITDLGIAIGSAVSVAANHRIDNRVMYSAGKGAVRMGILPDDVTVCYGIPLSVGSKSIFFDRGKGDTLL